MSLEKMPQYKTVEMTNIWLLGCHWSIFRVWIWEGAVGPVLAYRRERDSTGYCWIGCDESPIATSRRRRCQECTMQFINGAQMEAFGARVRCHCQGPRVRLLLTCC